MRCLVDENLPFELADLLTQHGHDVIHVGRSEWRGAADPRVWSLAQELERVLITQDLDFPLKSSGSLIGLLILRPPKSFRKMQIVTWFERDFVDQDGISLLDERVVVLTPGGIRSRPIADLNA